MLATTYELDGVEVEQQGHGTAFVTGLGVEDVGLSGGEVEGLEAVRVLVQQVAEVGRGPVGGGKRKQHRAGSQVKRTPGKEKFPGREQSPAQHYIASMEKLRKTLYTILSLIAIAVAVASILSLFRNTESRYLKMLDFPRIQLFLLSVVSLVLFVLTTRRWQWWDYLLVGALLTGLIVNGAYLVYYTPLVSPRVPQADAASTDADATISLLLINVKMSNRQAEPLLELIREKSPDLVLAMEVNEWWDEQLGPIEQNYPHTHEAVNAESYGMTLYSKYPFEDLQVNYLNNEQVPSFETRIELGNGQDIQLHTVHPVPPTHFKDLPDNAGQEEVAMLKLGKQVAAEGLPAIVAGDINDVVWGYTDELTGTQNLLHDVRVGRGFYNSYDAESFFLRWPLDHVFVTEEFAVVELERLRDVGSDHFPIYVRLAYRGN